MSVKVKISVIILLTLTIGIALGALLNRALLQHRIARAFAWRNPAFLAEAMEGELSPDANQSAKIRKILEDHAATMAKIRENSQAEMMAAAQALDEALTPLLTPEQKRRLRGKPFGPLGFQRPGRDPRRGGRRDPTGNPELQYWVGQLDLSEDQVDRLAELLPRQRVPFGIGPRDMQVTERMLLMWKNRQDELDKALAEVLTEVQNEKYQRLKQDQQKRLEDILLRQ